MQAGERLFHLRLHAHRTRDPTPPTRRLPGQVLQQHGPSHARITAQHQQLALTVPDGLNEPVKRAALAPPARQPWRLALPNGICSHGRRYPASITRDTAKLSS
jgi:hypothetical protein